jgi:hypothetical protein
MAIACLLFHDVSTKKHNMRTDALWRFDRYSDVFSGCDAERFSEL